MDIEAEADSIRSSELILREAVIAANSSTLNFTLTDMQVILMNIMATTSLTGKIAKHTVIDYFDSNSNNVVGVELKRGKDFANCVTLAYRLFERYCNKKKTIENKVSIKLFNNGKFQVSGCKSIDAFLVVAKAVCSVMSNILRYQAIQRKISDEGDGLSQESPQFLMDLTKLLSVQNTLPVNLVKFEFSQIIVACYVRSDEAAEVKLDLKRMEMGLKDQDYWKSKGAGPLKSVERGDRSPGLIIKYKANDGDKTVTAMVYRCGCVKFMGLKKFSDAKAIYEFLIDFMDIHWLSVACDF